MSIRFPHYKDVPLANSPLVQVIWQIRFDPILTIAEKIPARFQELIRNRFPRIEIRNLSLEKELPAVALPLTEYAFVSSDEALEASLGVNFVALTTRNYDKWSSFSDNIAYVYTAFNESFGQIVLGRIGLRYINNLTMEKTASKTVGDLLGFLKPVLTTLINTDAWSDPKGLVSQVNLDQGTDRMTLRFLYETAPSPQVVLDYDFYSEDFGRSEFSTDELLDIIGRYHVNIYDAFRWSLSEKALRIFIPGSERS